MVVHSATLAINEEMQERRRRGEPVVHLGFGEAGLPVLPEIVDALRANAHRNSYAPVTGSEACRTSVAGYLTRHGVETEHHQVMMAPGSKPLLYGLIAALPGDVVLPAPSWVSYAAQAALTGKRVVRVPIPAKAGGVPDPDLLEPALARARADGARPGILLLTLPDNPTGTTADPDLVSRVCGLAREHELVVVADEIYRDLAEAPDQVASPAALLDDHVAATGGLSKNVALGGWRVGFVRTPATAWGHDLRSRLVGIASEVWSCVAAPIEAAAAYVFEEPPVVAERVAASRRLHLSVSRAMYDVFIDAGATCRRPTAAFYHYPDLEALRDGLTRRGVRADPATGTVSASATAEYLLQRHGLALLPGDSFGDDGRALRFRVATSLLYGEGDQRLEALNSADPAALPWITESLNVVRHALGELA
ncbi:MAG: pyridoxal phosphate-dependent aminotransferase [Nocardioidaceae bacterium]